MPHSEAEFLVESQEENVVRRRKQILVGGVAVIVSVALIVILVMIFAVEPSKTKKLNVILMISDGWGPASATLTRSYSKKALNIDAYLVGTVRTPSYDSLVTDSAAGATAYSCGKHTYNGGIGIDENAKACATLLEAASQKGMRTGVVSTTRVTDATPAAFCSHASDRSYEDFIATQILDMVGFEKKMDVILGGGRAHFSPSFRADQQDLLAHAASRGYTVAQDKTHLSQVTSGKVLGLFADYNMAYQIDRENNASISASQPSLLEMTKKAFELLENDDGFFVMVEGALIDVAEHANDAAASIHEVLGYDETFAYVLQYAKDHGNTIIISTSDHETGGLTLGLQTNFSPDAYPTYAYYPELLLPFNASCDTMASRILAGGSVAQVIAEATNITDLTQAEIDTINQYTVLKEMSGGIGTIVSKRSLIGWTTHGHTGVDVNLYSYGITDNNSKNKNKEVNIVANHENIDIATIIATLMDVDLASLSNVKSISEFVTTPSSTSASRSVRDVHHSRLH